MLKTLSLNEQSERLNIQSTQLRGELEKERDEGQCRIDEKVDTINQLSSDLRDAQQAKREQELVIQGLRTEKSVIEGRVGHIEAEKGAYASTKTHLEAERSDLKAELAMIRERVSFKIL